MVGTIDRRIYQTLLNCFCQVFGWNSVTKKSLILSRLGSFHIKINNQSVPPLKFYHSLRGKHSGNLKWKISLSFFLVSEIFSILFKAWTVETEKLRIRKETKNCLNNRPFFSVKFKRFLKERVFWDFEIFVLLPDVFIFEKVLDRTLDI